MKWKGDKEEKSYVVLIYVSGDEQIVFIHPVEPVRSTSFDIKRAQILREK
jgi:hypothetical protein